MSPTPGKETQVTDLEIEILQVFMGHGQFSDKEIAHDLKILATKLEGNYASLVSSHINKPTDDGTCCREG